MGKEPLSRRRANPTLAISEQLGEFVRWARRRSFELLQERSGVPIDRSAISILTIVSRNRALRMSALAAQLGLDRSTISRQVAAAVRAGYVQVTPDANDARASLLSLTPRGLAARERLSEAWSSLLEKLFASWTRAEQATFGQLLDRLLSQVVEHTEDDRESPSATTRTRAARPAAGPRRTGGGSMRRASRSGRSRKDQRGRALNA